MNDAREFAQQSVAYARERMGARYQDARAIADDSGLTPFVGVSVIMCIILIGIVVTYFTSNCAVADCKVEIERMSYAQAVDILEDVIKDPEKPQNKEKFIENFFSQIRNTCVA